MVTAQDVRDIIGCGRTTPRLSYLSNVIGRGTTTLFTRHYYEIAPLDGSEISTGGWLRIKALALILLFLVLVLFVFIFASICTSNCSNSKVGFVCEAPVVVLLHIIIGPPQAQAISADVGVKEAYVWSRLVLL